MKLKKFIDDRLAHMLARPEMWVGDASLPGASFAFEALVLQLLEVRDFDSEWQSTNDNHRIELAHNRYHYRMRDIPPERPGSVFPSAYLTLHKLVPYLAAFVEEEQRR